MNTAQPFLIPSFVILSVSVPLVIGIVPRNRLYGFRTFKTLSHDSVWYPVNRFGGCALGIASLVYPLVTAFVPYDPIASDFFLVFLLHLAALLFPLAAAVLATLWYSGTR